MRFILALFAVVAVPLIALAIAAAPYYNQMGVTNPVDMLQVAGTCFTDPNLQGDAYNFCDSLREFHWLGLLAIITMALGLFVLFFSSIMSLLFGGARSGLAFSFRTVSLVALLLLSVITLFQAILVVASIYLGMSYFMGIMIPYLIIAAAIGGVVLTAIVIGSLFQMFKTARSSAIGIPLEDGEAPELRAMIDEIAAQLETTTPDNIVLGLEPTFFVTSVPTSTPFAEKELTGETIYLSLPLMRVLSTEETKSIIGHELGHFTGADTEFSKKFAPAYAGINHARYNLANQGHIGLQIGAMPINTILNFVLGAFEPAEKKISREREYRADEIGASVGSAEALSSALVKLSTLFHIWQVESHDAINRVVVGRGSKNLSRNFVDRGR